MNRRQFFGSVLGARLAAKLRVAEEPKDYWILGEGSLGETTVLRPFKVEMERIVNSESQWIDISRYVEKVTVNLPDNPFPNDIDLEKIGIRKKGEITGTIRWEP